MDEILLTPEEQENAANRGPDDDWTNICRAQVAKVYGYIRTHWVHARQLDYKTAHENTVLLTIESEDWMALKQAAREGVK